MRYLKHLNNIGKNAVVKIENAGKYALCTKDDPMTPDRIGHDVRQWQHSRVEEVQDGTGALIHFKCRNCGHEWGL
jgi:hypothetical protein